MRKKQDIIAIEQAPGSASLDAIQERLGYKFTNADLLIQALTHSSWAYEHGLPAAHNERLEFLGDATLELCVSHELFTRFPNAREGAMTEMRSRLVNEPTLAALARELGLDAALRLGKGEEKQGGREKDSILEDAFEAVIAAVYEDGGFPAAQAAIGRIFAPLWPQEAKSKKEKDPKTFLQETCQKLFGSTPVYRRIEASGPEHAKMFEAQLILPDGSEFRGREASAKKAEQAAAAAALRKIASS